APPELGVGGQISIDLRKSCSNWKLGGRKANFNPLKDIDRSIENLSTLVTEKIIKFLKTI
ncbi:MAG: hypothetical protein LH647_21935, partial [Leptolyngbyaceae cyanobacterium CAN_BIN12]|nr:hypothetical protein [Leptolyngbyaceae cyanobacterium CAN_BIN12]